MMNRTNGAWRRSELGYCSNVHPGESHTELSRNIGRYIDPVRRARRLGRMAAGLWIGAHAARALTADRAHLEALRETLSRCGVDLITLNGFPYGGFHAPAVKERVYLPDWSDERRYGYTRELAGLLAELLPEGCAEGTISTLPLGFGHHWSEERHAAACRAVCRLAEELSRMSARTGRAIRVCFEMEPDGVLESTGQAADFFSRDLQAAARRAGVPHYVLYAHLGVCYDVCHQAVMFEDPRDSLERLAQAGVTVGKIQLSSALHVAAPGAAATGEALARYAEPRYLHQVRTLDEQGKLAGVTDLPEALRGMTLPTAHPWRIHFHVPIQAASLEDGVLSSTREQNLRVLDYLADHPHLHPHLEVETYTWQVLPDTLRPATDQALIDGLGKELHWVEGEMAARGLLHPAAAAGDR